MVANRFLEKLQTGKVLVLDGATGTNLQRRGLPGGTPSDLWVLIIRKQLSSCIAIF